MIATNIDGRSSRDARLRFYGSLDPDVDHGEWNRAEEDRELVRLQNLHKNDWVAIGSTMKRSSIMCSGQWRRVKKLVPKQQGGGGQEGGGQQPRKKQKRG